MSLGEDGYDEDHGLTRTRLPEGEGDPYAPRRGRGGRGGARGGMSSRNLITVVGVVVLLIAAIAFANRGGGSDSGDSEKSGDKVSSGATAPSGVKPVGGKSGGIASGFARTEQGAQSAASNYAVALGSSDMFSADKRHQIVQTVIAPSEVERFQTTLDKAYSPAFFKNAGLNEDGSTPKGFTFVSRTIPVGSKTTQFSDDKATAEVWCTGLIGLAGEGSTKPVNAGWFTITMQLSWIDGDWKVADQSQKDGPAPVSGDVPASSAKDIANAATGYGGFTYAR
ncbi:hypothetical protein AB0C81_24565 [Streptomyces roseoverticillatus]|uniref:hypothetical protein n=1 Tax=Streptomyces roseoverticillatus TaxID=66429 RepID=UPI0033C3C665